MDGSTSKPGPVQGQRFAQGGRRSTQVRSQPARRPSKPLGAVVCHVSIPFHSGQWLRGFVPRSFECGISGERILGQGSCRISRRGRLEKPAPSALLGMRSPHEILIQSSDSRGTNRWTRERARTLHSVAGRHRRRRIPHQELGETAPGTTPHGREGARSCRGLHAGVLVHRFRAVTRRPSARRAAGAFCPPPTWPAVPLVASLFLLRPVLRWVVAQSGHGELLVLVGLLLPLGVWEAFELVCASTDKPPISPPLPFSQRTDVEITGAQFRALGRAQPHDARHAPSAEGEPPSVPR